MNVIKSCRYGTMMFNTNDEWIGRSFDLYGEFSEGEVDLFRHLIKTGDTVLDVGANIGALTIPMARFIGPKGRMIAFEPQQLMYYVLCGNIAINNLVNTDCLQMALSKEAGTIQVPIVDISRKGNFGGVSLSKNYEVDIKHKTVPTVKLDSCNLSSCSFIKIDVEGMEYEVLLGAKETIKKYQPYIYVEDDREENSNKLRALIWSMGYSIYSHQPLLYNPGNIYGNPRNEFVVNGDTPVASLNLLCVPEALLPQAAVDALDKEGLACQLQKIQD